MVSNVSETTGAAPGYRPRIALTTYYQEGSWGVWNSIAAIVPGAYVEGVVAAGGTPVLLPPVGTDPSVLELVDGLIVIGGVDVDPQFYGADRHERTFSQPHWSRACRCSRSAAVHRSSMWPWAAP